MLWPRNEVGLFASEIESRLSRNDDKGGLADLPVDSLIKRLKAGVEELEEAVRAYSPRDPTFVMMEAGNVGAFATMIHEKARTRKMGVGPARQPIEVDDDELWQFGGLEEAIEGGF